MFQQKVAKYAFTFIMSIYPSTRLMKIPNVPQTMAQEIKFKKCWNTIHNFTFQTGLCFAQLVERICALLQTVTPIHRPPLSLTVTNKIHENSKIISIHHNSQLLDKHSCIPLLLVSMHFQTLFLSLFLPLISSFNSFLLFFLSVFISCLSIYLLQTVHYKHSVHVL